MTVLSAAGGSVVLLAFFGVFGISLLVQFRGNEWLPRWVPKDLRIRPTNPILRLLNVLWAAAWSLGLQVLVVVQAVHLMGDGHEAAAVIFMIEIAAAIVMTIIGLRVSSRHESTR